MVFTFFGEFFLFSFPFDLERRVQCKLKEKRIFVQCLLIIFQEKAIFNTFQVRDICYSYVLFSTFAHKTYNVWTKI